MTPLTEIRLTRRTNLIVYDADDLSGHVFADTEYFFLYSQQSTLYSCHLLKIMAESKIDVKTSAAFSSTEYKSEKYKATHTWTVKFDTEEMFATIPQQTRLSLNIGESFQVNYYMQALKNSYGIKIRRMLYDYDGVSVKLPHFVFGYEVIDLVTVDGVVVATRKIKMSPYFEDIHLLLTKNDFELFNGSLIVKITYNFTTATVVSVTTPQ